MLSMEYASERVAGVEDPSLKHGCSSGTAAVGVNQAVRVGCGVPECGDCEWSRE